MFARPTRLLPPDNAASGGAGALPGLAVGANLLAPFAAAARVGGVYGVGGSSSLGRDAVRRDSARVAIL